MANIIEIILLIGIALFLVSQKSDGLSGLLKRRNKLILDSCALIDGRIVEIVGSGFVRGELVIPQFILSELQLLADGKDSHKRERARFGLDIAHQLQDAAPMPVVIDRSVLASVTATDDKLVLLAKKLQAQLYTTDYNLGKVAAVEGVKVLNVNELSQGLRPVTLPGETLNIKIVQKGSNPGQGVGYLDDGTMIVVENAAKFVTKLVPVTVTRMHQTVAGKMVFGQVRLREQPRESGKDAPEPAHHSKSSAHTASPASHAGRAHHASESSTAAQAQAKLHVRLASKMRRNKIAV